jgi:hypothetical protein
MSPMSPYFTEARRARHTSGDVSQDQDWQPNLCDQAVKLEGQELILRSTVFGQVERQIT